MKILDQDKPNRKKNSYNKTAIGINKDTKEYLYSFMNMNSFKNVL